MPVELVVEGVQCGSALVRADVGGGMNPSKCNLSHRNRAMI